jgi:2,3-bisphosphoglycerate-independent phosphoglycerate mutase
MDVGLVILDGWGLNPDPDARDAVAAAETPTFDSLRAAGASATLRSDGRHVGLPPGQMGNSEVGHLTIGAGRTVTQESARITDAIARWRGEEGVFEAPEDPPLDGNPTLDGAFARARETGGRVHLLGLVSDGGVHASQAHLHALVTLARQQGVEAVTHAFTDGRDTAPTAAVGYLRTLQSHADSQGTGHVATVSGRYYAMDRDENWARTTRAYESIAERACEHTAPSAVAAVEAAYDRGETDEFVEPTCVAGGPALADGDTAVFVNFRADRARQLTRMLGDIDPVWPAETEPPSVHLVTMTEYDRSFDLPVAFPPREPGVTLGSALAAAGHSQLRLAETEKHAHVTYFLNGGRGAAFEGERREIVPSPDVATYDQQPAMSARAVTDRALALLAGSDVLVVNYANPDMVGHTGEFDAAVAAVEAVDEQLGRLTAALQDAGAHTLVVADHGNAEEMGTPDQPHTAHTTNPVPVVYASPAGDDGGRQVSNGELADIAPTILAVLGIERPAEMSGRSLLVPPGPSGSQKR